MNTDTEITPIHFLKEKISDIRSALFFSQNNDIIKMPTSIITVLRVDDEGNVWFFVKRPQQYLDAFEKEFPARLDFFRKGRSFFLQVTGKAFIVEGNDKAIEEFADVTEQIRNNAMHELVLMKIKIYSAEYYDNSPEEKSLWWNNFTQTIQRWLFSSRLGYKPYDLKHYSFAEQDYNLRRA
ncbi:MAG TPA: pyridoxamine 5'-phosphate oxidase family protein [Chitinophagaceae bacterium]|nr:pyridoxamine 5'-phosphate oxidase family protein [Chitinophagaceae bacterium]